MSRSSFFYWQNKGKVSLERKIAFLQAVIEAYSANNGIYGAPKIHSILKNRGIACSVSAVSRAMEYLGIRSIIAERFVRKKSSFTDEEKAFIVNLIKNLNICRINQVWTTDITYIKTAHEGTFYLITYIDCFSRKVVAWKLCRNQTAAEMVEVLECAVTERKPSPGLIIHSDKGTQMRSHIYRDYLSKHNFAASYTSFGHSCDENAVQESFHAMLKKECVYLKNPKTYEEARGQIGKYIDEFYNSSRIHSSLNYLSPADFENTHKPLFSPSVFV